MKYSFVENILPESTLGKILTHIEPGSTILECGSASGYVTKHLTEKLNCQVYIVEYNQSDFENARQFAHDGICADLMQTEWIEHFSGLQFDYILFTDVLEHLSDPLKVLRAAVTMLKDSGSILVSLPNIGHNDIVAKLINGHWDYTHIGLLDDSHVHFWGLHNLEPFFKQAKLDIVLLDSFNVETGKTEQYDTASFPAETALYETLRKRNDGEIYQFIIKLQHEDYVIKNQIKAVNKLSDALSTSLTYPSLQDIQQELKNKEGHIDLLIRSERELKQALKNKKGHIDLLLQSERELKQALNTKEECLELLLQSKQDLQEEIAVLSNQLHEERHHRRLAEEKYERANIFISNMQNSRRWRLATKIASFVRKLIPVDSRRAMLCRVLITLVRHPLITFKGLGSITRSLIKGDSYSLADYLNRHLNPDWYAEPTYFGSDTNENSNINKPDIIEPIAKKMSAEDYSVLVVPQWENPQVSIIIPVYNQFNYTYHCVESILKNSGKITYEILIADDCSTDLTMNLEKIITGVQHIRNEKNLRFLLNCNNAAKHAIGKYVLFLNNDTQVMKNWLEPLVELIESADDIGMVGSKFIYPDGHLQEAGGIIWKDATAWNFGNGQNPSLPQFNYVKDADYISGASIMLSRALWEEIGGFDESFAPAYCEDSDLAFTVRSKGYRVLYQPLSEVVHFEGMSNGTDTSTGQKQYQILNREKLYNKWKHVLKDHANGGTDLFHAMNHSFNRKTVLFIDHYVPTFDKDAGSRTVFQYVKLFVKHGYNVKFIGDNFARMEPYTTILQQMGVEVLYGPEYGVNEGWKNWIREYGRYIDYVFLNRPHIAPKYIDVLREHSDARIIYYGHDLTFLRLQREAAITNDNKLLEESQKWREIELSLMKKADMSYYPSYVEVDAIHEIEPDIKVKAIPAYLFENVSWQGYDIKLRKDIMFIGGFTHRPNVDAAIWMAEEILPELIKFLPEIKIHVLGSNVPPEIQALESNNFVIEGFVSDKELEDFYKYCRLSIVPLRYGAGIKGKVIEAMRYGTPVITTSVGAEGIVNAEDFTIIKDDATEIAHCIIELYNNEEALNRMSLLGVEYIKNNFSYQNAVSIISPEFDLN